MIYAFFNQTRNAQIHIVHVCTLYARGRICFELHCLSLCIVHDLLQACTQRILWLYAPGPHNALAAHNQSHKSARNVSKQYTRLHSWPSQTETVFNQKHYWPLLWSESRCCFHGQCMVHGVFYCAGGARKS